MIAKEHIKLRIARRYIGPDNSLYGLEEIDQIRLHPQPFIKYRSLKPEASVVVANLNDLCIVVKFARGEDDLIYTGYALYHPDGGSVNGPCKGSRVNPGSTIRKAMRNQLENIRRYQRHYGDPPDRRIVGIVDKALCRMNSSSLRQGTIFDML